eukprot:Skav218138  [mRNA]  locus=scaffold759:426699:427202:- [translate_table: standard]
MSYAAANGGEERSTKKVLRQVGLGWGLLLFNRSASALMQWQRALRHRQLKDRLDDELAVEAKAEEALKAKARILATHSNMFGQEEQRMEHPADWQRVRDANIEAEKQRKGAYLRHEVDAPNPLVR